MIFFHEIYFIFITEYIKKDFFENMLGFLSQKKYLKKLKWSSPSLLSSKKTFRCNDLHVLKSPGIA